MKITRLTDYAFLILTALCGRVQSNAAQLAAVTALSETTVAKVLKMLVHADLVVSTRGAQGGYKLACPAAEITLVAVIEAIEGPIALTKCTQDNESDCELAANCTSKPHWLNVNDVVRKALANVTLLEMGVPLL